MTYHRVAPRDIFNEANFMKCLGRLALLIHDRQIEGITFDDERYAEVGLSFLINNNSGGLVCREKMFHASSRDEWLNIERPLNSREAWSIYVEKDYESIPIFADDGNPTGEFIAYLND